MKKLRAYIRASGLLFQAFVPLAPVDQGSKLGLLYSQSQPGDLSAFINGGFKFAIAIGAIAAVLRIAYAGALYMGTDMWDKKGKAKQILGEVAFGLLLLLAIYLILYQINPDIVKLDAFKNITPIPNASGGSGSASTVPQSQTPGTGVTPGPNVYAPQDPNNTYCDPYTGLCSTINP